MNLPTVVTEAIVQALMGYGAIGIAGVAFAEASLFTIPPDALLVAVAVPNPGKTPV